MPRRGPAGFVDRVWKVQSSSAVAPGTLYVFLSEGTLLIASAHGTPSLGKWRYENGMLTMVEEGIPYEVDILKLDPDAFTIRSHNPGGFIDVALVPAASGAPAASRTTSRSSFQAPASSSGRLFLAGGQLRFTPCGRDREEVAVEDLGSGEGAALVRELGGDDESVTVMVRIAGRRLAEVRYGAPEGPGCDRLPPEGEVEARGNEPFWMVGVDGPAARLRTPEEQDGMAYRSGRWSRPDGARWIYEAQSEKPDAADRMTLTLTSGRCQDSMSGAHYPFRAVLTRGKDRMEGCALEGRKATPDLEPR